MISIRTHETCINTCYDDPNCNAVVYDPDTPACLTASDGSVPDRTPSTESSGNWHLTHFLGAATSFVAVSEVEL